MTECKHRRLARGDAVLVHYSDTPEGCFESSWECRCRDCGDIVYATSNLSRSGLPQLQQDEPDGTTYTVKDS